MGVVAQLPQHGAEGAGGYVVGEQAGQDEDGVTVPARKARQQGAGGQIEAVVRDGAAGLGEVQRERRTVVLS